MKSFLVAGLLAIAAPLFPFTASLVDPLLEKGEIRWFELNETQRQVVAIYGPPKLTADFGDAYTGWQYQIGPIGDEDFSHYLVFAKESGTLVSIARNYDPQQNVDVFFPAGQTEDLTVPGSEPGAPFHVRVRRLKNNLFLLAMGISKPGEPCGQLVLIRASALRAFHPDIAAKLAAASRPE